MVEILHNKNSATRFQILVEIAASGPGIKQKSIAAKLAANEPVKLEIKTAAENRMPVYAECGSLMYLGSLPSLAARFIDNCQWFQESQEGA